MIEVEENHQQNIWTIVDRSVLRRIVERFRPKAGYRSYIPVSCPTAACVAGWTSIVTGGKMLVAAGEENGDGSVDSVLMLATDGSVHDISLYARDALGLTEEEASHLFSGGWSNRQVLNHLDDIMEAGAAGRDWAMYARYSRDDEDD